MLTVTDILADLYKLPFKIRNAATRTKSLKPTLYEEIDEETKIDKLQNTPLTTVAMFSNHSSNKVITIVDHVVVFPNPIKNIFVPEAQISIAPAASRGEGAEVAISWDAETGQPKSGKP